MELRAGLAAASNRSVTTGESEGVQPPDEIFNDALELPPEKRDSFLVGACNDDPTLLAELRSLVCYAEKQLGLLVFPAGPGSRDRLGRYRILSCCGAGGMGVVYKAEDSAIEFVVALKVLAVPALPAPDATRWQAWARETIEYEARCLARLNAPNVAKLYALEYDRGTPYLVMEFVEGQTLSELLVAGSLSMDDRLRICDEIAAGVEAAHEKGVIHRDLKPGNVMVTLEGQVKILDFGIAKVMQLSKAADGVLAEEGTAAGRRTRRGGTPGFMSPEQERGDPVDFRTDIWAIGRLMQIVCADISPSAVRTRLSELATRCLREDPRSRPLSVTEIRSELARIRRQSSRKAWFLRHRAFVWAAGTLAAVATVAAMIRLATREPSDPVSARLEGRSVVVSYTDGVERRAFPPDSMRGDPDAAWVVSGGPTGHDRLVLARSGSTGRSDSHLSFWNRRLDLVACVPTTRDSPYAVGDGEPAEVHSRKRFTYLFAPGPHQPRVTVLEYSHYQTSVLRMFEPDPTSVREVFRLYHAGHINDRVTFTPGLEGGNWMWISGVASPGPGAMRAARGVSGNVHFLACLDGDPTGIQVLPPWTRPDSAFTASHPDAVAGDPLFYFLLRGIFVRGSSIDWQETSPVWIQGVFDDTPNTLSLLLNSTVRIDLHREGPSRVHIGLSAAGDLPGIIERRAAALQADPDSLLVRFLADSVVCLAACREGMSVRGDFRDIQGEVPSVWKEWARSGATAAVVSTASLFRSGQAMGH